MSAAAEQSNFPTMIIPRGTEIRVNNHGQLSIKTPGNLVIQNSGVYSELESTNGSIRIEENVTVEAVSIKAAQACFIQGTLTAWKVHAKRISLEDRAKAFIMLQESETLELSRGSRLVGNFANEKELFLMLGKFGTQLKELPGSVDMNPSSSGSEGRTTMTIPAMASGSHKAAPQPIQPPINVEIDHLREAQTLLEREVNRTDLPPVEAGAIREVLFAVRERNVQRIGIIYRDAFRELQNASSGLREAYEHIQQALAH
jgi:hypothetical protein